MISHDTSKDTRPFDFDAMWARCLGKAELLDRALARFKSVVAAERESLQRALHNRQAAEVARLAHRLKGTSANVSALRLQAIFAELEELALAHNLQDALHCAARLEHEIMLFSHCADSVLTARASLSGV